MKESRQYIMQGVWLLAAAGLFTAAGLLQPRLERISEEAGLVPPGNIAVKRDPKLAILTVLPGGLRAPIVGWLWIRAEDLRSKGHDYDARQQAEMICELQPHFSGAWAFRAWDMSYNISVTAHTLEHRWLWVYNGIKLLRDRGIPLNPQSISLYRELGWIYFHKIGGFMDDFHEGYKKRWAAYMQRLLAPPPYGTTEEAIAAFRPIAQAPLDRDPARQGIDEEHPIQADKLAEVLRDPACAEYARLLGEQGVKVDAGLLEAYNRYSKDDCIRMIRQPGAPPAVDPNAPASVKALADAINAPQHAAARAELLAFVRAQLLWNQYRLDPQWMLDLMGRFGPLDWRLAWSHALYWATYGFHAAEGTPMESLDHIETLNNSRNIVFALQELTRQGRVTYEEDPNDPEMPAYLGMFQDPRFVEPTQQEYLRLIKKGQEDRQDTPEDNAFKSGHMNYLADSVQMLYAMNRIEEAQKLLKYCKDTYHLEGGEWDEPDVESFSVFRLRTDKDPGRQTAQLQIGTAIQTAYLLRLENNQNAARTMMRYARRVYDAYQGSVPDRNRLAAFEAIESAMVSWLLVQPGAVGYNLSLVTRSQLYRMADTRVQADVYPRVWEELRRQCLEEGLDFDKSFPKPG